MPTPYLNVADTGNTYTSTFAGLNRRERIGDGEFSDMVNMTSDHYPLLAPRRPRIIAEETDKVINGILGDVGFACVLDGEFHYMGEVVEGMELLNGEKNMVAMGGYILIFPDAVWYNTIDGTFGNMDERSTEYSGNMDVYRISSDLYAGTASALTALTVSVLRDGVEKSARQRFAAFQKVSTLPSTVSWYSLGYNDVNLDFYMIDGVMYYASDVTITKKGEVYDECAVNEWKKVDIKYISVEQSEVPAVLKDETVNNNVWNGTYKMLPISSTETGAHKFYIKSFAELGELENKSGTLRIKYKWASRSVPILDYVCVMDNRLWGCRYGYQVNSEDTESVVNEIYCSALGDFKRWTLSSSTSTLAGDPWTASVGDYGAWTGCVAHRGYVLFFKENTILRVSGTKPSNFTYKTISADGMTESKSMAIIDEVLYYKGRNGVYAYDGSLPSRISDKLGDAQFATDAVGGAIYGKYFLNMDGKTYVYDTRSGLWHIEGIGKVRFFTRGGGCLYGAVDNQIVAFVGSPLGFFPSHAEGAVEWSATTGDLGLETPYQKWYRGFSVRYNADIGARLTIEVSTDGGAFRRVADVTGDSMRTMTVQVSTQRCDHMRIRFSGKGAVKVYSIYYEMETASLIPERRI